MPTTRTAAARGADQGVGPAAEFEAAAIWVTATGWSVARAVAMVFDHELQNDKLGEHFSRII